MAHDRLIEPVRLSNQAWRTSQNAFHRQADLYREAPESQKADMLVRGEVLALGEKLKAEGQEFTTDDLALLTASRDRAKIGFYRNLGIAAAVLLAAVCGLAVIYIQRDFKNRAETKASAAESDKDRAIQAQAAAETAKVAADELAKAKDRDKERVKAKNAADDALRMQFDDPKLSAQRGWEAVLSYESIGESDRIPNELTTSLKRSVNTLGLSLVGKQSASIQNLEFVGPNRDWVLTRAADDRVYLWKIPEPFDAKKKYLTLRCSKVVVLNGGKWIATGHIDGSVNLWDFSDANRQPVPKEIRAKSTPVTAMAVGGGKFLAVGHSSGIVATYDCTDATKPRLVDDWRASKKTRAVASMAFSPWPIRLISDSQDGVLRSWAVSYDGDRLVKSLASQEIPIAPIITRFAISSDARLMAVGTNGEGVAFYAMNPETKDVNSQTWKGGSLASTQTLNVTALAFGEKNQNSDDHFAVAAGSDQTATVYRAHASRGDIPKVEAADFPLLLNSGEQPRFTSFSFGGEKPKLLIAGAADGRAFVWDATEMGLKSTDPLALTGPPSSITVVAIQPGNQFAFTGAADGSIRRWDLKSFRKNQETKLIDTLRSLDPKQLAATAKEILDNYKE